jgi:alpha-ketoglutarate-dependent taurine dioxygenase
MTTTSIGTKLGLRKITARIGAEVTGVSPSLELDPGTVTAIRAALSEQAVHTNDYDYAVPPESLNETERERRKLFISTTYETVHPVVRVHPLTGERGLFTGGFAQRIVGLSTGESKDILRLLQHYVTRPENILRVSWEPGQLVLFDNRITQHYAIDNYDDLPRRLNRVTVAGDVPVGIDGQPSYSVKGDASHYTPVATPVADGRAPHHAPCRRA